MDHFTILIYNGDGLLFPKLLLTFTISSLYTVSLNRIQVFYQSSFLILLRDTHVFIISIYKL